MSKIDDASLGTKNSTNFKEVKIGGNYDTAGFLYSPYRANFDERTKTLRFNDNTLRDILTDELLSRAVIWLLGYDARYPLNEQINDAPIRAQSEGSHWETAWCLMLFLDAWDILSDKYPLITEEFTRRLNSDKPEINPLAWLLTQTISKDESQLCWYGKEYDTAVVTLALLRAKSESRLVLSEKLMSSIDQAITGSLRWLFNHLEHALEIGKVDEEATEILEPLIYAERNCPTLFSKIWLDKAMSIHESFYTVLDKWLSYLEARLEQQDKSTSRSLGIGANEAYCLCRLGMIEQDESLLLEDRFRPFIERANILLLHYIEFLEEWLERDHWGGNLNRVWRLGTYVKACASIERSQNKAIKKEEVVSIASAEVVLKVLSIVKNEFFSNGSIYHSVYPTVYFFHSLILVWEWPESQKTIAQLYHELLDKFVVRLSVERRKNFELNRKLIERQRDLTNERYRNKSLIFRERKKRYVLLGLILISITIAILVYTSRFFKLSDLIQFAGVEVAVLALVLVIIEVIFLREH